MTALLLVGMLRSDFALASSSVKEFVVDGQKYVVIEALNQKGKMTRQTVINKTWQESTFDYTGDGRIDRWELSNSNLSLHASEPIRGQFMNLEVKRKEKTGTLKLSYIYHRASDSYHLLSYRFTPFHLVRKTNLGIGTVRACKDDSLSNMYKNWEDILDRLGLKDYEKTREELIKSMKQNERRIFHNNCFNSNFKDSVDAMIEGMADVILSERKSAASPRSPHKYLACLSDPGMALAPHVARIETQLYSQSNLFFADSASPVITAAHISCEERADDIGSYRANPAQVVFHKPIAKLDPQQSAREQYAETYFHEMLHASGIDEDKEPLVYDIENCCSTGYQDGKQSCEDAKKTVEAELVINSYTAVYADSFSGFQAWRLDVLKKVDPVLGDNLVKNYFVQLDEYNRGEVADRLMNCVREGKGQAECQAAAEQQVNKFPETFFATSCKFFTTQAGKPDSICQDLYKGFQEMLKTGPSRSTSAPAVNGGSVGSSNGAGVTTPVNGDSNSTQTAVDSTSGGGASAPVDIAATIRLKNDLVSSVLGGEFVQGGANVFRASVKDYLKDEQNNSTANNKVDPSNVGALTRAPIRQPASLPQRADRATRITRGIEQLTESILPQKAFAATAGSVVSSPSTFGNSRITAGVNRSIGRSEDPVIKLSTLRNPLSIGSGLLIQTSTGKGGAQGAAASAASVAIAASSYPKDSGAGSAQAKASKRTFEMVGKSNAPVEKERASSGSHANNLSAGPGTNGASDPKKRDVASTQRFVGPKAFITYLKGPYQQVYRSLSDEDVKHALDTFGVQVTDHTGRVWNEAGAQVRLKYSEQSRQLEEVK